MNPPKRVRPGDPVVTLNARGERNDRVALSDVVMGRDFPVVWVCTPEEWIAAQADDRFPEGVPWPAEDVALASVVSGETSTEERVAK